MTIDSAGPTCNYSCFHDQKHSADGPEIQIVASVHFIVDGHTSTHSSIHMHTRTQVLSCCSHYHVNKAKYSAIVPPQLLHLATSMGLALSSATHVLVCLL